MPDPCFFMSRMVGARRGSSGIAVKTTGSALHSTACGDGLAVIDPAGGACHGIGLPRAGMQSRSPAFPGISCSKVKRKKGQHLTVYGAYPARVAVPCCGPQLKPQPQLRISTGSPVQPHRPPPRLLARTPPHRPPPGPPPHQPQVARLSSPDPPGCREADGRPGRGHSRVAPHSPPPRCTAGACGGGRETRKRTSKCPFRPDPCYYMPCRLSQRIQRI